jgi:hypothetical protein
MSYKRIDLAPFTPGVSRLPFAMYFVYPKFGENFVVTGPTEEVKDYVDNIAKKTPCFWCYTYWKNGVSRGGWQSSHFFIFRKAKREGNDGGSQGPVVFELSGRDGVGNGFLLRRMPHKWIPEFDQFISSPL